MAPMADLGDELAEHFLPIRVYYEDTDAGGIVYHANYLRFAERARTEMLRSCGLGHTALMQKEGIAFAVTRCEVDFRAPARLDDQLLVVSRVLEIGAATLQFEQCIRRDGVSLAVLAVRVATINQLGRPVRMPAPVRAALAAGRAVLKERDKGDGVDGN